MEHVPISPRPDLPFEERIEALEQSFSGRLGFHSIHLERGEEVGRAGGDPGYVLEDELCSVFGFEKYARQRDREEQQGEEAQKRVISEARGQ